MGTELKIPDSFGQGMNSAFSALNAQEDNLSDGIGQGYGVIGYKGKVWSLRYRGERKTILRPDDGTPSGYIDIVVLGNAKTKSKSYYKDFVDGDTSPPVCASMDGITPDRGVADQQAEHCALCPRNVWKNMPNGKKGRECTDYKRLAVLIMPNQTKPILNGTPLLEPVFLRVPPDSLQSLAAMGDAMTSQGHHYSSYVTRITFDPNKAHPCMVFSPLQKLTAQEAPVILDLRKDALVTRIVLGDSNPNLAQVAHQPQVQLAPAGTVDTGLSSGTGTTPTVRNLAMVIDNSPGLGAAPPVTAAVPSPRQPALELMANGVFGTAIDAPSLTPSLVTAADIGDPEESDKDLDAEIAKLVAKAKG